MGLAVIDVEIERSGGIEDAVDLAQARLEEAEVVVERVAVGRLGEESRRVAPAAEPVAVAVRVAARVSSVRRVWSLPVLNGGSA